MNHLEDRSMDISTLLSTPIQERIPPNMVKEVLAQPPFLPIPGALNIRDISISLYVRKGFVYRSGALGQVTPAGKLNLVQQFGIRTIFDLRSLAERNKRPGLEIEGIETRCISSTTDARILTMKKDDPKSYIEEDGKKGYLNMYSNILDCYKDAFREVLLFLRDETKGGVLFHCTAGKDRTGVLAALILGLAGTPFPAIAHDYALTRIGIEPASVQLQALWQEQTGIELDQPGVAEMCGIKSKTMLSFLEMVEEKWGGVEEYVKAELGLTDEDIKSLRNNLKGIKVQSGSGQLR